MEEVLFFFADDTRADNLDKTIKTASQS